MIGREIEKACQGIYPLQSTYVRKAKILRAPKFDITKLMEACRLSFLSSAVLRVALLWERESGHDSACCAQRGCHTLCWRG